MRVTFAVLVALAAGVVSGSPVPQGTAKWVTLKGQVVWPAGQPIPEPKFHDIAPNHLDGAYTLRGGPVPDESVLVHPKTRGLKNVVVWLRPDNELPAGKAPFPTDLIHPDLAKPKAVEHTVRISFCRYDRHVLALRTGDTLRFDNTDPVPGNVRLSGQANDFNVLIPPEKAYLSKPLAAEPSVVFFRCSIHPWMRGFGRVFDHPYYAITDENGYFEMKLVPVGKWRAVYWHELGFHKGAAGRLGFPIEVKDDGRAKGNLPALEYLPADR